MIEPALVTAPAETPVTLAEVKVSRRRDDSDEDALLTSFIAAATAHLDGWSGILGRALVSQIWRQDLPGFPASGRILLPLGALISITSVSYYDGLNASQTLAAASYSAHQTARGPELGLVSGAAWPATYDRPDAVRVTWVCGYGAAADVPTAIKQAILLMIGHWDEHREEVIVGTISSQLPRAVEALLRPYRRVRL